MFSCPQAPAAGSMCHATETSVSLKSKEEFIEVVTSQPPSLFSALTHLVQLPWGWWGAKMCCPHVPPRNRINVFRHFGHRLARFLSESLGGFASKLSKSTPEFQPFPQVNATPPLRGSFQVAPWLRFGRLWLPSYIPQLPTGPFPVDHWSFKLLVPAH